MRWRRALAQNCSARSPYVAQSAGAFREVLGQFIKLAWQLDAVYELSAEIAAGSLEEQTSTTADLLAVLRWIWKLSQSNLRFRLRLLTSSSLFAMWMEPH